MSKASFLFVSAWLHLAVHTHDGPVLNLWPRELPEDNSEHMSQVRMPF